MPINELSFDIGFDASEFRKGIQQAAKDVDKFVRQTIGKRAGVVQGTSQFGSQAMSLASMLPGMKGGPIQQAISQRLFRTGGIGATKALGAGAAIAGGLGIGAVAGAGLLATNMRRISERRAEYVREQAADARRTLRPVSSLNYGSVTRQDVADIAIQDERIERLKRKVGRDTASFRQNFRGGVAAIAEGTYNTLTGNTIGAGLGRAALGPLAKAIKGGYDYATYSPRVGDVVGSWWKGGQPLPQYTRQQQRDMDFQASDAERRKEAIRQANAGDQLIWEIR